MFHCCDNKTNSENNPVQSGAYNCIDLCLLSFSISHSQKLIDIRLSIPNAYYKSVIQRKITNRRSVSFFLKLTTYQFCTPYVEVLYTKHLPETHRLHEVPDFSNELEL